MFRRAVSAHETTTSIAALLLLPAVGATATRTLALGFGLGFRPALSRLATRVVVVVVGEDQVLHDVVVFTTTAALLGRKRGAHLKRFRYRV